MDHKNRLLNLLKQVLESNKDYQLQKKYSKILDIFESCDNDYNNIVKLFHEDLNFINNEKFHKYFQTLQKIYQFRNNVVVSEKDIKYTINYCKEIVIENYKNITNNLSFYNEVNDAINNSQNEDIIFDFVTECFEKGYINIKELFELNFYIATRNQEEKADKIIDKSEETIDEREVVYIYENTSGELSEENISSIFNEYGYDYNKLPEKEKKVLLKYVKLENITKVFKFLKKYNFSKEEFNNRIGTIISIMIYYNEETIKEIENFIDNNDCTLSYIIRLSSIFFSRKREYKFRSQRADGSFVDNPSPKKVPVGSIESFMYCVNLIKKSKNLPEDYRLTDADLGKRTNGDGFVKFLTTPKEKIYKNLTVLNRYGLIDSPESLPNSITATLGTHTEYLLDRYIESGLYEYVLRKQSCLKIQNDLPFRWHKIKRAICFGDKLLTTNGLRSDLTNEEEKYGLRLLCPTDGSAPKIIYDFSEEALLRRPDLVKPENFNYGLNNKPYSKMRIDSENFNFFFKYFTLYPKTIFKCTRDGQNFENIGEEISRVFANDYNDIITDFSDIEEDKYIQFLDSLMYKDANGNSYPIKKDNLTYEFIFPSSYNKETNIQIWPSAKVIVSRQKVLRLCRLLKKSNLWLNDEMLNLEKENILMAVLLKDTIINMDELNKMRKFVGRKVNSIGGRQR